MTKKVTIGPKGQVVIPKEIREKTGLKEGQDVTVDARGDEVVIKRTYPPTESYVEYYCSTFGKKLSRDVDIRALLEGEMRDRTASVY